MKNPSVRGSGASPIARREGTVSTAIVFGVLLEDARTDWPGRNQLMLALTEHVPVVLLEASRSPRGIVNWRRPKVVATGENLFVVRDAFAIRSHRAGRRLARLAALIDGRWFRRALQQAGLEDTVFWLTVNDLALTHGVPAKQLVYDCMDPNFLPHGQVEFDRSEFRIARRAQVVFASARLLYDRMAAVNPHTYLLPNATTPAVPATLGEDPSGVVELEVEDGPVVGYLGTIDWRFDAEHVLFAARALPHVRFVLAGRVNADQEAKIAPLRELPNVVFPGQIGIAEGAEYVARFDVALIPFTPSEMNDAINPVKMYMYLSAGLPVVSTWIAECRANPFVRAAKSPEDFLAAIEEALGEEGEGAIDERKAFAAANTWQHRARTAVDVLVEHGLLR